MGIIFGFAMMGGAFHDERGFHWTKVLGALGSIACLLLLLRFWNFI
jgi:hypothetical protein